MRSRTAFSGTSITRSSAKRDVSSRSQPPVRRLCLGDTAVAVNPEDERYQGYRRQDVKAAADRPRDSGHRAMSM
ncbi:MAG: hypothetical protein ACLR8P_14710 [Clostridium fessum]